MTIQSHGEQPIQTDHRPSRLVNTGEFLPRAPERRALCVDAGVIARPTRCPRVELACPDRVVPARHMCTVTDAEPLSAARRPRTTRAAHPARSRWRLPSALLVGASLSLPWIAAAPSVGAADTTSLQAEATQLSQQLIEEELQVDSFEHQYETDSARVLQDNLAIAALEQSIDRDQLKVHADRLQLSKEAVSSYLNAGSVSLNQAMQLFNAGRESTSSRAEYESVAIGNTTVTLALLHTDQVQLEASQTILQARTEQDRAVEAQAANATASAQQVAAQLADKQALVQGQLAAAIAQDRAAQAQTAVVQRAAVGGAVTDPALPPFLQCVLRAESGGNYQAVSPNGLYMGGFQFAQATWNQAALLAGLPQLVGVPPNDASPADQDTLAIALYDADGEQPWYDPCRS